MDKYKIQILTTTFEIYTCKGSQDLCIYFLYIKPCMLCEQICFSIFIIHFVKTFCIPASYWIVDLDILQSFTMFNCYRWIFCLILINVVNHKKHSGVTRKVNSFLGMLTTKWISCNNSIGARVRVIYRLNF